MGLGLHAGSFLLLAAAVLLLVSTISSPVIDNIYFLSVSTGNYKTVFGVFGYCLNINANNNQCSDTMVGYDITTWAGARPSYDWENNSLNSATKGFIMNPVACGLSFIAFFIALISHRFGYLFAAMFSFLAFLASLAALVINFVVFGIVKHEINDKTSSVASYSTASWLVLAATIVLFLATFVVLFECCCGTGDRGRRRGDREMGYNSNGYVGNAQMSQPMGYKKHWWSKKQYGNAY